MAERRKIFNMYHLNGSLRIFDGNKSCQSIVQLSFISFLMTFFTSSVVDMFYFLEVLCFSDQLKGCFTQQFCNHLLLSCSKCEFVFLLLNTKADILKNMGNQKVAGPH